MHILSKKKKKKRKHRKSVHFVTLVFLSVEFPYSPYNYGFMITIAQVRSDVDIQNVIRAGVHKCIDRKYARVKFEHKIFR